MLSYWLCSRLQAVIQLSSSNHTYKAVPSDPNVLLHNSTQHVQLSLASPQDACQPLANSVTGIQAYYHQGGTRDHHRPHFADLLLGTQELLC